MLGDGVRRPAKGFICEWEREISYLGMRLSMFRHRAGLRVLSVDCADPENSFIGGFQTCAHNDTGVQHVIEHVVLGGSRNFQVKGPCDELSRGSLATYINAETYLDRTLFPYSSLHREEFKNGLDVYLDGMFNPLLSRETFMQEGWRYELVDGKEGRLSLRTTGIVLNERRAQLNDMSDVAMGAAYAKLLPGHPLSWDSGGLPGVIETLDYDEFLKYYREHYRLSQGHLFFYGNIPTEQKLTWVNDYVERYCQEQLNEREPSPLEVVPEILPWTQPRVFDIPMAVEDGETDGDGDCGWTLNWHVGTLMGPGERLGMELLYMLLLEDDSSPLRQALQESGRCEDLIDCTGLETEHGQCLFLVGVVNCRQEDFAALKKICLDCLGKFAREGFAASHVRAAYNQLCLRYQEIPNGYGLQVGRQIMRNWLSGQDPLWGVDYRACLDELQGLLEDDPKFLQSLLNRYFIDNPHRAELHLIPDQGLLARRQAEAALHWQQVYDAMSAQQHCEMEEQLRRWRAYQEKEDSAEALASFPHLVRSQLPAVPYDPVVERKLLNQGTVLLRGIVPSNGINYVKLGYDANLFSEDELEVLPVFACLLDSVGTSDEKYGDFERRLAASGAELDADVQLESVRGQVRTALTIKLGGLARYWEDSMDCLAARVRSSVFTERGRLRDVLRQCWSQAGQKLYSDDDSLDYVLGRSGAGVAARETLYEGWYGVAGVRRLRECQRLLKGQSTELTDRLEGMMDKLRLAAPSIASYVGNDQGWESLAKRLDFGTAKGEDWSDLAWCPEDVNAALGRQEWIPVSKHGSSCVRSFRTCTYEDPLWAEMCVYCELLSEGYLQEAIRMGGGAYGGGCSYYPASGMVQMFSYSDPQPQETFKVFERALGRVQPWSDSQITGAIVGCVRGDVPLRASESCNTVLTREMIGLSDEARGRRRQRLLNVTLEGVQAAAEALKNYAGQGWNDCVAGEENWADASGFSRLGWGR